MWLARNKDNSFVLVEDEVTLIRIDKNGHPVHTPDEGEAWYDSTGMHDVPYFHTCKNYFPDLKWEDEPIEVELRELSTRENPLVRIK